MLKNVRIQSLRIKGGGVGGGEKVCEASFGVGSINLKSV